MSQNPEQPVRRKYRKPPVVEIAADFQMAAGPEWKWEGGRAFLEAAVGSGEPIEALQEVTVRREQSSAKAKPPKVQIAERTLRMRRYAAGRTHCIQIGPNRLTVNCLKSEGQTPTYTTLEPLIVQYLTSYLETFGSDGVESLSLSYVDDVHLPVKVPLDLGEYLNFGINFPDVFGATAKLSLRAEWVEGPVAVNLEFQDIQPYIFRLDWQGSKSVSAAMSVDRVMEELAACRGVLRNRFDASFTEAGHSLFEPE